MTTATDVVSYVGIPLAVVGVLPILYTTANGIVTVANIKKRLRQNGLQAATRGSYLAGVVEVELPRWTITPLDRDDPKYWTLNPDRTDLYGGTWTTFNWNQVATGRKIYRLQYSVDLREPQAEVQFEELLAFLLDRGAIPDAKGLHMLRLAGLFTPIGTSLLLSPDGKEIVLRIAPPDESDGVLSLVTNWKPSFDRRHENSLPPSWMRVENHLSEKQAKATDHIRERVEENSREASQDLVISARPIAFHLSSKAGLLRIDSPAYERNGSTSTQHLPSGHLQETWFGQWIPAVAAALGQIQGLALWTCHIPDKIAALARKDALPCGVMVVSGILPEDESPLWETKHDPHEDAKIWSQQMMDQAKSRAAENRLPPAQAEAARILREANQSDQHLRRFQQRMERDRKRKEQRTQEALNSSKLDTSTVAQASLAYLRAHYGFEGCENLAQAVSNIIHLIVRDAEIAKAVCEFLNRWVQFSERGGMNISDFEACCNAPKILSMAICLIACVKVAGDTETSSLAFDLQECVSTWKKVRLG